MSRVIVRTIYGSAVQTTRSLGLEHSIPSPHAALHYGGIPSTGVGALNTATIIPQLPASLTRAMQVAPVYDAAADTGNIRQQYFCIGNGGHRFIQGPDPLAPAYTSPIPHRATDSGLYRMIPFLIRNLSGADLSIGDRAKYRLRRVIEVGGQFYAAYYAKKLDFTGVAPELTRVDYNAGNPVSAAFAPNINNLNPTQPSDSTVVANSGSYVSVRASLSIPFTADEVAELLAAMQTIYGNENFAVISEVALCTGVDKLCTHEYTNAASPVSNEITVNNPTEAVGVQVATHISTYYPLVYANSGLGFTMDLGATEPLFGVGSN